MTDHKATHEQWAMLEERSAPEYDNTILELRARVEALESKYETQRLATLEWGKDVDTHARLIDKLWKRVEALEAAQQQTEPIDEEENDRRFHACIDLIRNATPEQIRAAAGLPERSSLVKRVALAISGIEYGLERDEEAINWASEARAAIREVAATLRAQCFEHAANWLEQEADRG